MNWKISTEKIKSYACENDVRKVSKEPFCSVVNLPIIYPLNNRNCTKNNLQLKQVKKKKILVRRVATCKGIRGIVRTFEKILATPLLVRIAIVPYSTLPLFRLGASES